MILDEKQSILRSKQALPRLAQGSKGWTWTSFMTFLTNKKKENIFSKFCQRGEHDLSRKSIIFPEISASTGTVGTPIQINIILWNYQSEKSDWIQTYDVLASLTKVREKCFLFFLFVRNIINDVHVHPFDPWASLGSASFEKPLKIDVFSIQKYGFPCQSMVFFVRTSLSKIQAAAMGSLKWSSEG